MKVSHPCCAHRIAASAPANLAVAIHACSHHKQTTPPILYFPFSCPLPIQMAQCPHSFPEVPGIKRGKQGDTTPLHQESKQKAASVKTTNMGSTAIRKRSRGEKEERERKNASPGATLVLEKPAAGEKTSSSLLSWSESKIVDFTVFGLAWAGVLG